ncbi:MAG: hypothetical protein WAQ24_04770 [Candidatus Saccharimonadales bacterium]
MQGLWKVGAALFLFAAVPTSTNYTLKSYNIGSGGASSGSTNYKLQAGTGAQSGAGQTSANYKIASDGRGVMDANVPPAPSFTNPANYYDRLKLVLNTGNNPSDTKYLIAVSTDGFVTTKYVQTDNALGASQAITSYQTYTAWGGASGFYIIGLAPSTSYQVKVKALQGSYTGSAFGPTASASTVAPSLSFSVTTTQTSTPPFAVGFTSLTPGTVMNGGADVLLGLTTNANNGGTVYVRSASAGLFSTAANTTIASNTADLGAATSGYGGQITTVNQTSGGPFSSKSPYDGSANTVGALANSLQPLLGTATPVVGGTGTLRLMAKSAAITPSAPDYTDTLTLVASMNY